MTHAEAFEVLSKNAKGAIAIHSDSWVYSPGRPAEVYYRVTVFTGPESCEQFCAPLLLDAVKQAVAFFSYPVEIDESLATLAGQIAGPGENLVGRIIPPGSDPQSPIIKPIADGPVGSPVLQASNH